MMQRTPRIHDEKHLAFIRTLPCLVNGNNIETQAAHIRYSDARAGKFNPGVGAKPDDKWTVPLSNDEHRRQHAMGERRYWESVGIDPIEIARRLYAVSDDYEQGCKIVACARRSTVENILAAG